MTYPDTLESAVRRILGRVQRGGDVMAAEAAEVGEDEERRAFRLLAEAGARRYAEILEAEIEQGPVDRDLLERADLVAIATECAGWLTCAGAVGYRGPAMSRLIQQGVFAFYDAVPGRYVACYRLVAP